jgi:hypothetical protein
MVGGQAIDLAAVGRELTLAELENMHIHKTGALIRASVLLGALSQPLKSIPRCWSGWIAMPSVSVWPSKSAMTFSM